MRRFDYDMPGGGYCGSGTPSQPVRADKIRTPALREEIDYVWRKMLTLDAPIERTAGGAAPIAVSEDG
jgi:hypothetical protein